LNVDTQVQKRAVILEGDAVNPDGTLKDASEMEWLHSPTAPEALGFADGPESDLGAGDQERAEKRPRVSGYESSQLIGDNVPRHSWQPALIQISSQKQPKTGKATCSRPLSWFLNQRHISHARLNMTITHLAPMMKKAPMKTRRQNGIGS